jgi:signal peptidase I
MVETQQRRRRARRVNVTAAERRAQLAREIVEVLLFVAIVIIIVNVVVQTFLVQDVTMQPLLQPNQRALVNKQAYFFSGPKRGDVVLVADPTNPSILVIRRVIAIPGDTVTLTATSVTVNGATLNETPYTGIPVGQAENDIITSLTMKAGQYYVMGDNRLQSAAYDSRGFGAVPQRNILGKTLAVFWPLSQFHWMNSYPDVFSSVPAPHK